MSARSTTGSPVDLSDYTLAWPRDVFVAVAARVLTEGVRGNGVVEVLVREAFVDGDRLAGTLEEETWRHELPATWIGAGPTAYDGELVRILVDHVDELPAAGDRAYWSERRTGTTPKLSLATVRAQFIGIIEDLYQAGYFDKHLPKGCVDEAGSDVDPNDVLTRLLGRDDLWPLTRRDAPITIGRSAWDDDTLFDLIEVFHDLAARPRFRSKHYWNDCGWHFWSPDRRPGQLIYRWRVNDLLARSEVPYRLADTGDDVGRLVAVTDDARTELADNMAARTDPAIGDRVRHALAQFRARAATEHDKRSAIITLAGVLEERRKLLKANLFRKDEDALFIIANDFAIRHRSERQKSDYDPAFLDWVFWWYLATIDLTDRILDRQGSSAGPV